MRNLTRQIILTLFAVLAPAVVSAQIPSGYVQTTATVSSLAGGSYGASWTNLSSSPQLGLLGCVSAFQTTVNGTFDAYGHFSTLLADTAQICPSPSTWNFTFAFSCPPGQQASAFQIQVAVTGGGGTEDISSQINAALPAGTCNGLPVDVIPISKGGTSATTAAGALANLGGVSLSQTTPQTMAGQLNLPSEQVGGAISGNEVSIRPLSTPPSSWTLDLTTPATSLASMNGISSTQTTPQTMAGQLNLPSEQVGGGISGNGVSVGPLSTPPSNWTLDLTTPATSLASIGGEPSLGNPSASGYVLSSTSAGLRSWVPVSIFSASYYQTVQENGTALAQQPILNFDGTVVATAATGKTNVGLPAKGNAGTYTSLTSVTFDTQGRETGATAGVAVPRTCNVNGCYKIDADGTITEWGYFPASNITFTFPYPFSTGASVQSLTVSTAVSGGLYSDPAFGYPTSASTFFASTRNSNNGNFSNYAIYWHADGY